MNYLTSKQIQAKTGLDLSTIQKHAPNVTGAVKPSRDWLFPNHSVTWDYFENIKRRKKSDHRDKER